MGGRGRVGGMGSLGLSDANYCSWNGFTMRSCCVALRTLSLDTYIPTEQREEKKSIHVKCNFVPMLHSGEKKKKKESTAAAAVA